MDFKVGDVFEWDSSSPYYKCHWEIRDVYLDKTYYCVVVKEILPERPIGFSKRFSLEELIRHGATIINRNNIPLFPRFKYVSSR